MKKVYVYIAAVALLAGSCKKSVVELQNPTAYDYYTYFNSTQRINEAVVATYAVFLHPGMYSRDYYYIFDLLGNDAVAADLTLNSPPQDLGKLQNYSSRYDQTNKNIDWLWASLYRMVLRANVVLDRVAALAPSIHDPADSKLLDQYTAEARFLRGYANFQLMTLWGKVPLRKSYEETKANVRPVRASLDEIKAFIMDDLNFATANNRLPLEYDDDDLGRATRGAAVALLGKFYLYQGNWAQAKTQLEKLTQSPYHYDLSQSYDDDDGLFGQHNQTNEEIIFQVMHGAFSDGEYYYSQGLQESSDGGPVTHSMRASEYGFADRKKMKVSDALLNAFKYPVNGVPDSRAEFFFYEADDPAIDGDSTFCDHCSGGFEDFTKPGAWWKKYEYYEYTDEYGDEPAGNINSVIIRYADVSLMLAEVYIEQNNLGAALDKINDVRNRANAGSINSLINQTEARKILRRERQIELCGEQSRFFDLVRWGQLVPVLNSELGPNTVKPYQVLLPIPQQERTTNPNILIGMQNNWN